MTDFPGNLRRPEVQRTPFCPGCGHGILGNAVLRAISELKIDERNLLFVSGIGCAGWISSPQFNFDTLHTLHGRAIPFAVGAKRANPALTVVVVSGDGDLLSIGGNHLLHAAARNDDITVICADNHVYGMTGGQSAPTTPLGAKTLTHPSGSDTRPLDACAVVRAAGARYTARFPVTRPAELSRAIREATRLEGFTFVEALSPCPTQYGRRNDVPDIAELYDALDRACVDVSEISDRSTPVNGHRPVIGVFR